MKKKGKVTKKLGELLVQHGKITEVQLKQALEMLQKVTASLLAVAMEKGPAYFLSDATLYLEMFGIITIAWQWLVQGIKAQEKLSADLKKKADKQFYLGKAVALRYFFNYELPKTEVLGKRLMNCDGMTVEMGADLFSD